MMIKVSQADHKSSFRGPLSGCGAHHIPIRSICDSCGVEPAAIALVRDESGLGLGRVSGKYRDCVRVYLLTPVGTSEADRLCFHHVEQNGLPSQWKMEMQGTLIQYGEKLHAFLSGTAHRYVVMLGGLTDGFLPTPYVLQAAARSTELRWTFVQPLLSSSYQGYGTCSLKQDVRELDQLFESLSRRQLNPIDGIVMIGHSTGCQISVLYAKRGKYKHLLRSLVLQGPVSDRLYREHFLSESTKKYLAVAKSLISAGEGDNLMPKECEEVPITADRYWSLAARGGEDDLFSTDEPVEALQQRFSDVEIPTYIVFGTDDQYCSKEVLLSKPWVKLASAFPCGIERPVEGGNHELAGHEQALVEIVAEAVHNT